MAESYPRSLNGEGCVYGRNLKETLDRLEIAFEHYKDDQADELDKMRQEYHNEMEKLNDRLTHLAKIGVGVLVFFATTSLGVAIDITIRLAASGTP